MGSCENYGIYREISLFFGLEHSNIEYMCGVGGLECHWIRNIMHHDETPCACFCMRIFGTSRSTTKPDPGDLRLMTSKDFHYEVMSNEYSSSGLRISGWWFEPLWKILINWGDYSQYMEEKTCSKPPTYSSSWTESQFGLVTTVTSPTQPLFTPRISQVCWLISRNQSRIPNYHPVITGSLLLNMAIHSWIRYETWWFLWFSLC